jgi:DNA-binding SARP family transcriptional activator
MVAEVEFRVLGPLEVRAGSHEINIAGARQRLILAVLLLRTGHLVPMSHLITAVWGDDPPQTAWRQVQNGISLLRMALNRHGGADLLDSGPDGYRLRVDAAQVDLGQFRGRLAEGRDLAAANKPVDAARTLRAALALWRGPALAGLSGEFVARQAVHLDEERLCALEECVELELRGGAGGDLVAELSGLLPEYPLRERFASALMLALYRIGRQADALETYHRLATVLADQLGVDPGPAIRARYQAILREEPELEASASDTPRRATARPAQLPARTPLFVGRAAQLRELDALLDNHDGAAYGSVVILGTAGVGKTLLASHWAHRVTERFADGQLYINLRGFDLCGSAMPAGRAVRFLLESLGVAAPHIPSSLEAQVGLYRSLLAGKRVLVVLDNARNAEQVRPLLPGAPGCLAIVTSRVALTALSVAEGAHTVNLDLLTPAEAREMLARRIGPARTEAEPDAVDDIIALCARLPLALAVVAARVTTHPTSSLTDIARALRDAGRGLDAFAATDPSIDVRAVFSWSYRTLGRSAAHLFRLLAQHCGPDIAVPAAASLAGMPAHQIRPILTELTAAQLLTEHSASRYTFHDLLRAYANELGDTIDTEPERRAALHRVLDHYLHTAHAAALHLHPHRSLIPLAPPQPEVRPENPADHAAALAWFTNEHPVLLAAIEQAATTDFEVHAWQLAWTLTEFFDRRAHLDDQAAAYRTALESARQLSDVVGLTGQAHAHRSLGRIYAQMGRYAQAQTHFESGLNLYRELGDQKGQADIHHHLGWMSELQGRHQDSLLHGQLALDLYKAAGDLVGQARALNAIGWSHALLGDHERCLAFSKQALELNVELGDRPGAAATWDSIGYAHHHLGQYPQATAAYQQSLRLLRELGDRANEADVLDHLGDTLAAEGDRDTARAAWRQAFEVLADLGHHDAERIRAKLSA